jgi:hypothetical protein
MSGEPSGPGCTGSSAPGGFGGCAAAATALAALTLVVWLGLPAPFGSCVGVGCPVGVGVAVAVGVGVDVGSGSAKAGVATRPVLNMLSSAGTAIHDAKCERRALAAKNPRR